MAEAGEGGLLRRCREALDLSAEGLAGRLHLGPVGGGRTVRRWEAGDRAIPGPVWVALRYMMQEASEAELWREIGRRLWQRPA
jgi:transcriptional regulator with XRE-family HTH domain